MKKITTAIMIICLTFFLLSTLTLNACAITEAPLVVEEPANQAPSPFSLPYLHENTDGSYTPTSAPDWVNHWFSIDYWTAFVYPYGYPMPSKMNGTFVAVDNTFNGLDSGDLIYYLPLNVAYGTSVSNYVWFQFAISFFGSGSIQWTIWDNIPPDYQSTPIGLTYTVGHTYIFELTTSGSNTVAFSIKDQNTGGTWSKNSWHHTIPGITMIYKADAFSPASAVEGYTTNSQLTNVPYFMTYTGYGITRHSHTNTGTIPTGIATMAQSDSGTTYYYWAMTCTYDYTISSVSSYGTYGYGSVYNPSYIIGAPNGQYTRIYGGNPGDGGYVQGNMNAPSGGYIYAYAYSVAGYYSDLYVYVSNDNQNWNLVGETYHRISSSSPSWVYVGQALSTFRYIIVVGYDTGNSVNLYVDAIRVSD
ncbi:MAG: hypothetical protein QW674_07095 [Candidatus Bathyarchaeia archaeon]